MTQNEAIEKALLKANNDQNFRSALFANPKKVLSREFPNISFSDDINLDMELSDADLDSVSGGIMIDGGQSNGNGNGNSGCFRGTGVGATGQGQGKGQGQENGQGQGLNTD